MIHFDKVTKIYADDSIALEEVTLKIEPKEFVSIVGHSGAGKTTLIKMILAEENPTRGVVLFESTNIHKIKRQRMPEYRRRFGTVFQDFRLIPNKTVFENIAFAMEAAGRSDEEIASDVPHVLELVDLGKKIWSFPRELSGGEKQRVAIARALVNSPSIIIADEPTGNLDPKHAWDVIRVLEKINRYGTTVLLTTHNQDIVNKLKRRVVTIEDGRIASDRANAEYRV